MQVRVRPASHVHTPLRERQCRCCHCCWPTRACQDASLSSLQGLAELRTLQLGGNELSSLDAIQEVVEGAPCLLHIDLKANPVCKQPRCGSPPGTARGGL